MNRHNEKRAYLPGLIIAGIFAAALQGCGGVDEANVYDYSEEDPVELVDGELRPSHDGDFPDPFILRAGSTYYGYATNAGYWNVLLLKSTDLKTWTFLGDALPRLPSWAASGKYLTWAPAVLARNGNYVLYFTARHVASGKQCIGMAQSTNPAGPFNPVGSGPLVCQTTMGGSIDPSPFVDTDGKAYLLWKNDGNCCGLGVSLWSQELASNGLSLVGSPARLINKDRAWETPLIENPAMVKNGSTYYLFYSANWWESGSYATGYATCTSPKGGCTKRTVNGPWLASQGAMQGPGGMDFFKDANGKLRVVFHAWTGSKTTYGSGGKRSMYVNAVDFVNGIPRFLDSNPTQTLPPAPNRCGFIKSNEGLRPGGTIKSCDGRFTLNLQTDGNLVLYKIGGGALWSSKTYAKDGYAFWVQGDGNAVLYTRSSLPLWHTQTGGRGYAELHVQNDGNLVLYASGRAVWASNTAGR